MNITRQYPWKQLVILFVVSLLLYSIIAWNFGNYRVFYDEVAHNNYAKAIAAGDFFEFRGEPIWYFEVLYSMIISPVFMLFDDTVFAHYAIMFLNSVMMSSAVFPIYLIASRLLEDKKISMVSGYLWCTNSGKIIFIIGHTGKFKLPVDDVVFLLVCIHYL